MTGHGAAHQQEGELSVAVEVRTVNSRYFKLAARISEGYAALESRIDENVRRHVRRGTVQLDLRVERRVTADDYRINDELLTSYLRQLQNLARALDQTEFLQIDRLLDLPGVVEEASVEAVDIDTDWPLVQRTLAAALNGLSKMRADEGKAMATDLSDNCQIIREQLDIVDKRAPAVVEQYRERITDRVNKLLAELDVRVEAADVIREVALFAERSDISEEIVRLRSHLDLFAEITDNNDSSGRKLEFITQEMFREANTIGSKANDSEIARHVVEIKASIERIREMIQNIE
jgi:uncharacterized protein (TIGR00255 family)